MAEVLDLAQKLSGVSTPVLAFLIIYGSYKRIWVWGSELAKSEATSEQWKEMALQAAGLAKTSVEIAKSTRS